MRKHLSNVSYSPSPQAAAGENKYDYVDIVCVEILVQYNNYVDIILSFTSIHS